jgi:four helix bundle protein
MKKKKQTFNVQPSTFNASTARVREDDSGYKPWTSNGTNPSMESRFDLEDRLLEFTARILAVVDALPNTRAANHIAGQLLRSGTSPFAHHGEVQAAESRKDFVHKLGVCFKELKEIKRWLRLLIRVQLLSAKKLRPLLAENDEIIRIFAASIRTAEKNAK